RRLSSPHTIRAVRIRRRAGSRKPCWIACVERRAGCCVRTELVAKSDRNILLLLGLITVARLIFAASFPPLDDEAYYWTWAHHLAWGYPDHPPMIAFVLRGSIALAGDTPLGIRMGPVLLALGSPLLLWDLGRQMFGAAAGRIAALWFQLIPALALGAIFAAPDAPLGFFWILTLWSFWRAVASHSEQMIFWLLTGLAL